MACRGAGAPRWREPLPAGAGDTCRARAAPRSPGPAFSGNMTAGPGEPAKGGGPGARQDAKARRGDGR